MKLFKPLLAVMMLIATSSLAFAGNIYTMGTIADYFGSEAIPVQAPTSDARTTVDDTMDEYATSGNLDVITKAAPNQHLLANTDHTTDASNYHVTTKKAPDDFAIIFGNVFETRQVSPDTTYNPGPSKAGNDIATAGNTRFSPAKNSIVIAMANRNAEKRYEKPIWVKAGTWQFSKAR